MIRLYDYVLSGNCYKVRLFLSLLEIEWETRWIDFHPRREHKSEWFLALNPLGQVPVIEDGDFRLRDAQAILVYTPPRSTTRPGSGIRPVTRRPSARSRSGSPSPTASPRPPPPRGSMTGCSSSWMRTGRVPGRTDLFRVLDEHLWFQEQEGGEWLCGPGHPTIADIACFPYVALSEEGGVSRIPYPAIRRWTDRVKRIPGFVPMSGVLVA